MLLSKNNQSSGCGALISRQASTGHLAEEKKLKKLAEKKSARSKRCKSLLMLSSPFSSSTTSSMKLSLLSLLQPNHSKQQTTEIDQAHATRRFKQRLSCSSATVDDIKSCNISDIQDKTFFNFASNSGQKSPCQTTPRGSYQTLGDQTHPNQLGKHQKLQKQATNGGASPNDSQLTTSSAKANTPTRPAKCVKMKLFEQPLDKLFSPKAMKQLNNALNANSPSLITATATTTTTTLTTALGKRKRSSSQTANTNATNACLRKLFSSSATDPNNNSNSNNNPTLTSQSQVKQLLLSVLPEPIRNLLIELYLRGPSTVGIFRKSPNAKHCRELRQKLESDSQSSIQQFQVTVIASVFKEWLRSLPDCLLMSRLYHQWIDVAKLIEPLYQHRQPHHQSQSFDDSLYSNNSGCNTSCDNTMMLMSNGITTTGKTTETPSTPTSLRPSRSPLTDNGHIRAMNTTPQPLDRAHSCSTMLMLSPNSDFSINKLRCDSTGSTSWTPTSNATTTTKLSTPTMSAFALSERHSECLRIVRQLLDALNESNLILLRSFICILWHIAQNSDHNKMSANNLGVCVGQSLLNDEHQPSGASAANTNGGSSTFSKRHRRARSQCLLSSTLSLTNSNQMLQSAYLDSSGAQETAKYVPILVAFMIENAPELFGQDIEDIFGDCSVVSHHKSDVKSHSVDLGCTGLVVNDIDGFKSAKAVLDNRVQKDEQYKQQQSQSTPGQSFDQVDAGTAHHLVNCSNSSPLLCDVEAGATTPMKGNDVQTAEIRDRRPHPIHRQREESHPHRESSPKRHQIFVDGNVSQSSDHHYDRQQLLFQTTDHGNRVCNINDDSFTNPNHEAQTISTYNNGNNSSTAMQTTPPHAGVATTSILIVNSTSQKRHQNAPESTLVANHDPEAQQHRPLSATESTSSSRASSSTSGVHSESSNASSSGSESSPTSSVHNGREGNSTTVSSPSPSPSIASSPSNASSTSCSPTQEDQQKHLSSTSPCTISSSGESSMENHHATSHSEVRFTPKPEKLAVKVAKHQQQEAEASVTVDTQSPKYHNSHLLNNRYSTFTGILSRVPKIPVQFTTSSYGGEAVIYNPRPRQSKDTNHTYTNSTLLVQNDISNPQVEQSNRESVISIKSSLPLCSITSANQNQMPQPKPRHHQRASIPANNSQQDLRLERLNGFLAHQNNQQQSLVSAPSSLAYLPQSNYVSLHPAPVAVSRIQQQQNQHKQQSIAVYPCSLSAEHQRANPSTIASYQQHQPHHHNLQHHPIFYSTANLSSVQQMQQRDHYLLYHRASLNPQRSHVMSLRDYYLSLQLQNQQRQQQQQITYRNRLHPHQQQQVSDTINKFHPSSQQQHHHQRQYLVGGYQHQQQQQQQPLRSLKADVNSTLSSQLTAHHAIQTRPQTRLAKIRQNQFNGIYVNNATAAASDCSVIVPKQMSAASANVAQKMLVKPMSSASSDHSSDVESDESMNEAWMESTMV